MPSSIYLGLDVAKASVTLASEPAGLSGEFPTDTAGLSALVQAAQVPPVTLVVVEATGGYEAPVVAALVTAGLPVAVVNPPPSPRLRQGAGAPRQDRPHRRPGAGALRGPGAAGAAPAAG
jgi:transposase